MLMKNTWTQLELNYLIMSSLHLSGMGLNMCMWRHGHAKTDEPFISKALRRDHNMDIKRIVRSRKTIL